MIFLKNKQKKININSHNLKQSAQEILNLLGYKDFGLGIWLTTNETIQKFNKKYRKQDKATDILSFPYHAVTAGKKIKPKADEDYYLGDLIISLEFAQKDSIKNDLPFDNHILELLVHGICHLLGYEHDTDENYKKMYKLERKILSEIKQY